MYTILVLTKSSIKMFVRNRQALFFSLFMPLLILVIFGNMNFGKQSPAVLGLVIEGKPNFGTSQLISHIKEIPALTVKEESLEQGKADLKSGDLSAVVVIPQDLISIPPATTRPVLTAYLNQSQPIQAQMVGSILSTVADKATLSMSNVKPAFDVKQETLTSPTQRYIDFLLPGVIAMSVMQMSVLSVAFVFARYREQGVLKRILATPVKPYQFVTANILARLTISLAQTAVFAVLGVVLFHVQIVGAIWLLVLCVVLGAVMFLGLGFTISGLAKTIETVPVYANLIVFPMLFLGNVFFGTSNAPKWLKPLAEHLPLTYFSRALRSVMTDGAGFWEVRWNLLGTFVWAVVLVTLATITFRVQDPESA